MLKWKNGVVIVRPLPMKDQLRGGKLFIPLGPLYLATSLLNAGYAVTIVDEDNENALNTIHQTVSENTLCFCISTMSGTQLANAVFLSRQLKSQYPHIPVIWGGVHVTTLPEQTLKSDLVDYIVWGEGEDVIVLLLDALKKGDIDSLSGAPGIGWKKDGQLFVGGNSGYTSLHAMFHLPYHLLHMDKYARALTIGAEREYPVWTSRGCPFKCRFCSNSSSKWPNTKVRFHTVENVVNDAKVLVHQYGADMISFADENFLMDEGKFVEILQAIRREGIFIKYRFAARVDLLLKLKDETWEAMKEYGVVAIGTAPESGSQKILDYMGKKITVDQIYQLDQTLSKYQFFKAYNVLICTPQENRDDLKQTLKLVSDLASTSLSSPYPFGTLHKYIPLPGTELFEDAIQHGFTPPDNLEEWGFFDFDNVSRSRDIVRPWISEEDFHYIQRAITLVEKLNHQLKGPRETDVKSVKHVLDEIGRLISEG